MIAFHLAGLEVRASFAFFALLTAFLLLDTGGFALVFLTAAALHELGHLVVMAFCRVPVRLVDLSLGGLYIQRESVRPLATSRELAILAAGAGVNLLCALLFFPLPGRECQLFSAASLALALYQLLPLEGSDGGSILALVAVQLLGAARGELAAQWFRLWFSIAALAGLCYATLRYGFSPGLLLMVMVFVTAVRPNRRS